MSQQPEPQPAPMPDRQDHPGVIAKPPFLYGGALIAGLLLDWVLPLPFGLGESGRWIVAAIAMIVGILLASGGTTLFGRAGTNVSTAQPSTTVVTHGLYRFSRNPIYVGLTLLYSGIAFAVDSAWPLLLLLPLLLLMRYGVIAREERYLEAKFGEAYRAYKARVRRWL